MPMSDPLLARDQMIERLERYPLAKSRPLVGQLAAIIGVALATLLRVAVDGILGTGFPYVTFFPVVVLVAFLYGWRAGVTAAVLGGLISWYMFIDPRGSFSLSTAAVIALGFYLLVVTVDLFLIDWMQRAVRRMVAERGRAARLAEQRRLLFEELQHRVGNNLQVVGALLSAQRRQVTDPASRQALEDAANRLTVIGQISRQLYDADGGLADGHAFLHSLANAVLDASGRRGEVDISMQLSDDVHIDAGRGVPMALILTETLNNALEHGLPDRPGTIRLDLSRDADNRICLDIIDDGNGLPADFDIAAVKSLGVRIARQLAQQLGGAYTLAARADGQPGTHARLLIAG